MVVAFELIVEGAYCRHYWDYCLVFSPDVNVVDAFAIIELIIVINISITIKISFFALNLIVISSSYSAIGYLGNCNYVCVNHLFNYHDYLQIRFMGASK